MLCVDMLCDAMPCVTMLSVVLISVVMLCVFMLFVVMLCVIMIRVVASSLMSRRNKLECFSGKCKIRELVKNPIEHPLVSSSKLNSQILDYPEKNMTAKNTPAYFAQASETENQALQQ
jgi:hypothetical protein